LEKPGIWSLQVLESPGKRILLSIRTLVKLDEYWHIGIFALSNMPICQYMLQ